MPISFKERELEFLKRNNINLKDLKTRWEWVKDKQIAIDFYREVIYPIFNRVPKKDEIDRMSYRGFRNAIRRIDMTMNEIIKLAGYKPLFELKYKDMNYNDLIEYFKEIIYSDVKVKLSLEKGKAPSVGDLERKELGYRGFINRVRIVSKELGITKNILGTFMKKVGLEPVKELFYEGMDFPELFDCYIKNIYPKLKQEFKLKPNQAPLKEHIVKDYSGFLAALRRKGYNLTDLHLAVGFGSKNLRIYAKKSYSQLISFFKKVIQPSLQDIYDYPIEEPPSYEEVERHYRGFLLAIKRHEKKFSELVKESGFSPRDFSKLGVVTHCAINSLLSLFINQVNVPFNYYIEVILFYPSSMHRIDGLIFVSNSFLNHLNVSIKDYFKSHSINKKKKDLILNLINHISKSKILLFEFSNGFFKRGTTNIELIARKVSKYLDFPDSFLILVGTLWEDKNLIRRLPLSIKYRNRNISTKKAVLISPTLLSVIFGLIKESNEKLEEIIFSNKSEDVNKLKDIVKTIEANKSLKIYSTEDFLRKLPKTTLEKWL